MQPQQIMLCGVIGGVCLAMYHLCYWNAMTERRSESGIIVWAPSKFQPGFIVSRVKASWSLVTPSGSACLYTTLSPCIHTVGTHAQAACSELQPTQLPFLVQLVQTLKLAFLAVFHYCHRSYVYKYSSIHVQARYIANYDEFRRFWVCISQVFLWIDSV